MIGYAQAEMYDNQYGYDNNYYQDDNNYYQDDNRYSYDKKDQKSSHTDIQKISCGNSNVNVNGVDVTEIPHDNTALGATDEGGPDAANTQNGNGFADGINFDRNLVNVCVNANGKEQTRSNAGSQPPDGVTLFTCQEGSNLGAGAKVTDEDLCNAATPAEQCPTGSDLAGVWVVDKDAEGACDVEGITLLECGADTNLGAGAFVTNATLCNAAAPAELCGPLTDLEGVWVEDASTDCFIDIPAATVNATTYENAGNLDTSSPLTSTANCDAGDVATGGGFTKVGGNVQINESHKTATGQGWLVNGTSTGTNFSLRAFVDCLNNPLS